MSDSGGGSVSSGAKVSGVSGTSWDQRVEVTLGTFAAVAAALLLLALEQRVLLRAFRQ